MLTIGLLLDNLYDDYQTRIWESVLRKAENLDANLICFAGGSIDSPDYYHTEKNVIYDLVHTKNVDGLIAISGSLGNYITYAELNRFFKKFGRIPVVSIGVPIEGMPAVCTDNERGMHELIAHLIEEHGCRHIAFITGPKDSLDARLRFAAYENALVRHGLPIDQGLIIPGDFSRQSGQNAVRVLFDERKTVCDAIVGANDYMSIYAIKELSERGMRVPSDVIITGFDDVKESYSVSPSLTTVQQPLVELGEEAVSLAIALIRGEDVPRSRMIPPKLVIRRSCGCVLSECSPALDRAHPARSNVRRAGTTAPLKSVRTPLVAHHSAGAGRSDTKDAPLPDGPFSKHRQDVPAPLLKAAIAAVDVFPDTIKAIRRKDWIPDFLASALREGPEAETECLLVLEAVILDLVTSGHDVSMLFGPVNGLIDMLLLSRPGESEMARIERIKERALVFIGLNAENAQKQFRIKAEEESLILRQISQEFIHTYNNEQLSALLENELPRLGIGVTYLALYLDATRERVRLFFRNPGTETNFDGPGDTFSSNRLVPGHIKNTSRRLSLIVMPLYFKKEKLGFIIFEIGTVNGSVYETLAVQVSNALKGAALVEEVQKYANELEEKVRQRTLELERANSELEKANEQKTRFFINIAHETKSPLTLIRNYLDKYIRSHGTDSDLRIVKQNIDKLLRDMVNFLDSEKLARGQIFYNHNQVTDLSELIDAKVVLFREIARNKQITISFAFPAEHLYIKADPYAIDRVVNNLLDNAIRYTNSGGLIDVRIAKNGNENVFEVNDTGIGMTSEQIAGIFEPYYQLSHKKRNIQGIGMGLYIVREILDTLAAKLELESRENEGTKFCIRFCCSPPDAIDKAVQGAEFSAPIDTVPASVRLDESDIDPRRHVILLVDDNIEMLSFLAAELRARYNVFCAGNGRDALDKLRRMPVPDIIISDIMMDGMDGHEFFHQVYSNEELRHIPFIFLTARSSAAERLRGLEEGAVDFIPKPFAIEELAAKADAIIRNQSLLRKKHIRQIGEKIIDSMADFESGRENDRGQFNLDLIFRKYRISAREAEVIGLLVQGLLNKEISDRLHISIKTLDSHIHNIYKKLNVQNKVELINFLKS